MKRDLPSNFKRKRLASRTASTALDADPCERYDDYDRDRDREDH